MSDRALENAKAQREQMVDRKKRLLAEIGDIDDQIGRIDAFVKSWHAFADGGSELSVENVSDSNANKTGNSAKPKKRATGNSRKEDVADAARYLISERGEPIMRDELYDLLTKNGMVIHGRDPRMVLSTMLWRMKDKVVRLSGGGYWLADHPYEPAGYSPSLPYQDDQEHEKMVSRHVSRALPGI